MADQQKSLRKHLTDTLLAALGNLGDSRSTDSDAPSMPDFGPARDLFLSLVNWAGKSKDEVIQILCRETGTALASVLREPLMQALDGKRLRLTLEFVPAAQSDAERPSVKRAKPRRRRRSRVT